MILKRVADVVAVVTVGYDMFRSLRWSEIFGSPGPGNLQFSEYLLYSTRPDAFRPLEQEWWGASALRDLVSDESSHSRSRPKDRMEHRFVSSNECRCGDGEGNSLRTRRRCRPSDCIECFVRWLLNPLSSMPMAGRIKTGWFDDLLQAINKNMNSEQVWVWTIMNSGGRHRSDSRLLFMSSGHRRYYGGIIYYLDREEYWVFWLLTFDCISVWPLSAVPSQRTADGWRWRADEFCSFSLICLAVEHRSCQRPTADCGRVDDRQTNSVLFHLSVWPSSARYSSWK